MSQGYDITIRPATVVDVDEVAEMWRQLAGQHSGYNADRWNWRPDATQKFAKYFCDALGSTATIALVAQESKRPEGELAGFLIGSTGRAASVLVAQVRGEISDLYVHPQYRRRGAAAALISRATEIMKTRGAEHVVLSVAEGNDAAMEMYRKLGFTSCVVQFYKKL